MTRKVWLLIMLIVLMIMPTLQGCDTLENLLKTIEERETEGEEGTAKEAEEGEKEQAGEGQEEEQSGGQSGEGQEEEQSREGTDREAKSKE